MARRKSGTKRRWQRPAWLHWPAWDNVKRSGLALAWLALIGGLVAGAIFGVPRLEAHAVARSAPEAIEIEFIDAPQWFRGDLHAQLAHTVKPLLAADPFSRDSLIAIREGLLEMGWFEDIAQVRRERVDRIAVEATYVEPFAVIRDRDGDHLVDRDGRLLPRTYRAGASPSFLAVMGTRFPRPARVRSVWEGTDVAAALALVELIQRQPWRDEVVVVDVTGQSRGRPIRFVTDRGSRIVWGSPPGEEGGLEALADAKLKWLGYLRDEYGHIDMNHQGEVDITKSTSIDQR